MPAKGDAGTWGMGFHEARRAATVAKEYNQGGYSGPSPSTRDVGSMLREPAYHGNPVSTRVHELNRDIMARDQKERDDACDCSCSCW